MNGGFLNVLEVGRSKELTLHIKTAPVRSLLNFHSLYLRPLAVQGSPAGLADRADADEVFLLRFQLTDLLAVLRAFFQFQRFDVLPERFAPRVLDLIARGILSITIPTKRHRGECPTSN